MKRRFLKNDQGSTVVLIALAMTVMLGFVALVVDGGMLFLERHRLQKAVDAAVLAGAQELPEFTDRSVKEVKRAISLNGISDASLNISISESNRLLEVEASHDVELTFARALGISHSTVSAVAAAGLRPLTSGVGAIPLGVDTSSSLDYGSSVKLKVGDAVIGNFGALALTGPGARDYETDLKSGYQFEVAVGQLLDTQTGNMAGPTKKAIEERMAHCPYNGSASYSNYPSDCPLVVLVPIYETLQVDNQNQVKTVKVKGFASFFIEGVTGTNTGSEITGRYLKKTHLGDSSSSQENYQTYGLKIVK